MKYGDVDLNYCNVESPSVWREWIEMMNRQKLDSTQQSLPPCGGSGLKYIMTVSSIKPLLSPSVWREWIEMSEYMESVGEPVVSLRVEGVD